MSSDEPFPKDVQFQNALSQWVIWDDHTQSFVLTNPPPQKKSPLTLEEAFNRWSRGEL